VSRDPHAERRFGGARRAKSVHWSRQGWAAGTDHRATDIWEDILVDIRPTPLSCALPMTAISISSFLPIPIRCARIAGMGSREPEYGYVLGHMRSGWRRRASFAAPRSGRSAIARNAEDGWRCTRSPCCGTEAGSSKHRFFSRPRARPGARRMRCPSITAGSGALSHRGGGALPKCCRYDLTSRRKSRILCSIRRRFGAFVAPRTCRR